MNLGNKIMNLRKKNNLSQENLAEKVGVSRQTISKWELNETTPDVKQARELSKIFKVSLDELTDNDSNNILIEKVSNTEKLAGIIIKILKIIGVLFIIFLIIDVVAFILFTFKRSGNREIVGTYLMTCELDKEEYYFDIQYNKNFEIITAGGDGYISDHTDVDNYSDANKAKAHVEDWFESHNGSCTTIKENK